MPATQVPVEPETPTRARVPLCPGKELVLLEAESTAERLATRDDFVRALTPLDRRLRMGVQTPVDEAAFLAFARAQARDFERAQIEKLTGVAQKVGDVLNALGLAHWLPAEILVGQTTGAEEGLPASFDLSYTRSGVIYLNARALKLLSRQLLLHELFHIVSTNHAALREDLYRALGFEKVNKIDYPAEIEALRMTTPEVPRSEHALHVTRAGVPVRALPMWTALEPAPQGIMLDVTETRWAVLDQNGKVVALVPQAELAGVVEQVGNNTPVMSGPEEILAENFVTLVLGTTPRSPDVIARMRVLLTSP